MDSLLAFVFGILVGLLCFGMGVILRKQEGLEGRIEFLENEVDGLLDALIEAGVWNKEDVG